MKMMNCQAEYESYYVSHKGSYKKKQMKIWPMQKQ